MPVGGEVPLSPPPPEEDVQDSMVPVAPSARTTERDATAMAPPGVTVKVLSTATAAPAPMPVTRAVAAPVSRTAPACRFQVAIGPLLGLVCAVPSAVRFPARSLCAARRLLLGSVTQDAHKGSALHGSTGRIPRVWALPQRPQKSEGVATTTTFACESGREGLAWESGRE